MIEHWTEMRTALFVARYGTVSAAADALGLHRATVLRHVDLLEGALGEKLFHRHGQGYDVTEAGRELMRAAGGAEARFVRLEAQIRARKQIENGDIALTATPVIAPWLLPAVRAFHFAHPDVVVRCVATQRNLDLEKGEAHVAVRDAPMTAEPEHVVLPFVSYTLGLYASDDYLARNGAPEALSDLARHSFVAPDISKPSPKASMYHEWLANFGAAHRVVFLSNDLAILDAAISSGFGLGFLPTFAGNAAPGLRRILPEAVARPGALKLVTHVDFHRTPKIQALLSALKDGWSAPEG